jgi:hypothetical protein
MTFAQILAGVAVFLGANSLVYHFTNDRRLRPSRAIAPTAGDAIGSPASHGTLLSELKSSLG